MKKNIFFLVIVPLCLTVNTVFAQSLKNKVIAHQGAWLADSIPGNTLTALNRAIALGCGGSEFDVWMTADGVPVVNHDPLFQGLNIETSTYPELKAKKLRNGEYLPTVEEFIKTAKEQKDTRLILEIKPSHVSKDRTLELAKKCVRMVKNLRAKKLIDYITFDYDAGLEVIKCDKKADVYFLASNKTDVIPSKLKKDGFAGLDYHISVYRSHPEYFDQAKKLDLTTIAWTVDKEEDMVWLLTNQVDYITTNVPDILFSLIKKGSKQPENEIKGD